MKQNYDMLEFWQVKSLLFYLEMIALLKIQFLQWKELNLILDIIV